MTTTTYDTQLSALVALLQGQEADVPQVTFDCEEIEQVHTPPPVDGADYSHTIAVFGGHTIEEELWFGYIHVWTPHASVKGSQVFSYTTGAADTPAQSQ
jgi:hypothetical protein